MARVSSCCCFNLKTGTIIIAILGWIGTALNLFVLVSLTASHTREMIDSDHETLPYKIGWAVVHFIVCALLILGIYKKSTGLLIPYLIVTCLQSVGITIAAGIFLVLTFIYGIGVSVLFIILACLAALAWYFWIVVYSYYHELKAETEIRPSPGNMQYGFVVSNPPPFNQKGPTQFA